MESVNEHFQIGYECMGGIAVVVGEITNYYIQAMIKKTK